VHCGLSFEVTRDERRQTVTCFARIATVRTSVAPRSCKSEAHRTSLLGIQKRSIWRSRSSLGNSSGALPGGVSSSLRRFDSSHWTLAWASVTEHLQNALPPRPPRCKTTAVSGASRRWPHAVERALPRLAGPGGLRRLPAPAAARAVPAAGQVRPSGAAPSWLTALPVRGPYNWGLFLSFGN